MRIEVLKLLMQGHYTQEEVYEKTGATLDLLVVMQAAGETLSFLKWLGYARKAKKALLASRCTNKLNRELMP